MRIIYDLGANNGDDIPYYLMKADVVVAVEANPVLCEFIVERFKHEHIEGRLIVENCVVLCPGNPSSTAEFFLHKTNHVLSRHTPPKPGVMAQFEKAVLPAKTIDQLISAHGEPFYIKIDLENYDAKILRSLFTSGIFPPYISAEAHSIEIFALLVAQGGYNAFKLVNGATVSKTYSRRKIHLPGTSTLVPYSFPVHSAGPFGNDIDGPWMTAVNFVRVLALYGCGWIDIHATSVDPPDRDARPSDLEFLWRSVLSIIKNYFKLPMALYRHGGAEAQIKKG